MDELQISLIQTTIVWENKLQNLKHYENLIEKVPSGTDIIVLPEMFSTGFSMNAAALAELPGERTIGTLIDWAEKSKAALTGSFISRDERGNFFNRGFFITPEEEVFFYDKRHLFRPGEEHKRFLPGNKQPVIPYKGWNINLIICYDLRFPVWIRNVANKYDLLICTANWPDARKEVWRILLRARAIENCCYVCGLNRIGKDGNGINYTGQSGIIDYKGSVLIEAEENKESIISKTLSKSSLIEFREKFPVWKDADRFDIYC